MRRRDLLKLAAMSAGAPAFRQLAGAQTRSMPVIDTHIHLFDPTRPGGVPWPEKGDVIYKPSRPPRYAALSAPLGIVGAIAIECSSLASDNDWLLNVVGRNPIMVGMVGDLIPGSPSYRKDLDRLHANPLFLGIRYGNLWNRDLYVDIDKPGFVDGLKALAEAGLVMDSANPDPRLIAAILRVTERVPDLRIVVDHLPNATLPAEKSKQREYWANLHRLAQSPRVYVKLAEISVRTNGNLITDPAYSRAKLDAIWDVFGEDHVLFGSDWPNSDHVATYAQTFAIVRAYIAGKSDGAREKYFWKNSIAAYRWKPRRADQRAL